MNSDSTRASLNLLFNISRELATLSDLGSMLARVLTISVESVGAERGSLVVVDASGQPVDAAIMVQGELIPQTLPQMTLTLEKGLAGWVARSRAPALVTDTSQDARWLRRPDDASDQSGAKSAVCVPLLAREQLVGVLTLVHSQPGFFDDEHLAVVQTIGDIAGIAVHNAHLYDSLDAARSRYYDLFENSIDPIIITSLDGLILECNRQVETVTGFSHAELAQQPLENLLDSLPELSGEAVSFEAKARLKTGGQLPVSVYAHYIDLEEGQRVQWIVRDISAQKKLETLRDDLTSMIYHDLRSPLSNVISSLDMLLTMMDEAQAAALTPVVQIAMRSAQRVQRLIYSLLDVRRLEAGQPITTRQLVRVSDLLAETAEMLAPMVQGKNQPLLVEMAGELPIINIDADMIRRALINLLENASKFSPQGGVLALGAQKDGDFIRFWVRDSGMGIPVDVQEKIFDKYTSLNRGRSTGSLSDSAPGSIPRGLGLGLAFCRLAVQAHGGRIWVESHEGQGSTFLFTLPVTPPA